MLRYVLTSFTSCPYGNWISNNACDIIQAITGGVIILSMLWYLVSGRHHYKGPQSNLDQKHKIQQKTELDSKSEDA